MEDTIKRILQENPPIEVDTSIGYWEGNASYWTGGETIEYWYDPEDGICISVRCPDGRGANWIAHNFYCEREVNHPEVEGWYCNSYERYIEKLVALIKENGVQNRYDLSNWEG